MDEATESMIIGDDYASKNEGKFWNSSETNKWGKRFKSVSYLNYFFSKELISFVLVNNTVHT